MTDPLDELEEATRALHQAQARQSRALAAVAACPPKVTLPGCRDKDWVREQVACILSCSPDYAGHRLAEATVLARHEAFVELLAAGEVNMGHARALTDAVRDLDDDAADRVVRRALPRAAGQSVSRFRAALRRAAMIEAPRSEEQQREANVAQRCVRIRPYGPGVSSLWALLPEADAAAIATVLDRAVDARTAATALGDDLDGDPRASTAVEGHDRAASEDDERTADQRRADALVRLVLSGDAAAAEAAGRRLRPLIQVTVGLSTLLGLDEQPADLTGAGPIPAELARRLAADPTGTWRRLVTDEYGQLLDYGRTAYRPPAALEDFVNARDRTCRFSGCTRPAQRCEIDHRIAWADGGPTSADNLHVLCERHHHLKHETQWQVTCRGDSSTEWTDPSGRRHVEPPPEPYPIDVTLESSAVSAEDQPVVCGASSKVSEIELMQ